MNARHGRLCGVVASSLSAWLVLSLAPAAAARDCNGNGSEDSLDIEGGASRDCDSNGVPDECDIGPGNLLFSDPVDTTLEGRSSMLLAAVLEDYTADGLPDLVSFEPDRLLLLEGSGGGAFAQPSTIDTERFLGLTALSADTNGDGLRDLVAAVRGLSGNRSGLLTLEQKAGGGLEEPAVAFQEMGRPVALAAADLDGDGAVDIAAANSVVDAAIVWWNDGAGAFAPGAQVPLEPVATSVAAGDLDGDGDPDVLVGHFGSSEVSLLRNEGGRQFAGPDTISMGAIPFSVVLGDLDHDGDLDVASSGRSSETLSVVLNRGGGAYSDPVLHRPGGVARHLVAADADGDGSLDLVFLQFTTDCQSNRASLGAFLNRGDGSFIAGKDREVPLDPSSLALGDVDRDGLLDAVVLRLAAGEEPRVVASAFLGERGPWAADADADGVPDECALEGRDCNWNGVPDASDIALGTSRDCNADVVPDECEPDCDSNGIPDACDIAGGAADADSNGLLDACESRASADCNENGRLDSIDISSGASRNCDTSGIPDECEVAPAFRFLSGRAARIGLGGPAGGLAAADLDLDGDLDLAAATRGSCCPPVRAGSVVLFENLGEGKLAPAGGHAADGDPVLVAAVDADGDGDPDLVAGNAELRCRGRAWAGLLVNDGRGGFRRGEGFALTSDPAAIAVADIDRDGKIHLVFANAGPDAPAASVFRGDGTGAFALALSAGPPGGASSIAAGDWSGDGLPDLAIASGSLHLLRNAGGGSFTPSPPPEGTEAGILSVAGADPDGDGDLDLIAGHAGSPLSSPPRVALLRNDGGTFSAAAGVGVGTEPRSLLPGDWNGDGTADVVAAGTAFSLLTTEVPGGVSVLLNGGNGALGEAGVFLFGSSPPAGAAGDLDGDGALDLALADRTAAAGVLLFNEGDGRLAAPLQYEVGPGPRVVPLDANGDGDQDLAVVGEREAPEVTLLVNEGRGSGFGPAVFRDGLPPAPRAVAAGDLDGDGDPDLAVAGQFEVGILRNDGGALVGAAGLPVGSNPFAVVASDLDGDGDIDLATANVLGSGFNDNVSVFRNAGSGDFRAGRNFAVGVAPVSLAASDLDGDGLDELIAGNSGSSSLTVLRNLGAGGFADFLEIPVEPEPFEVRGGDIDGDGDSDLLFSSRDRVQLITNLGSGAFLGAVQAALNPHSTFELADLDRDGDPDLVVAAPDQVHVLRNGEGSFADLTVLDIHGMLGVPLAPEGGQGGSGDGDGDSGPAEVSSIAASDLDGDGDLDLALALSSHGRLLVLPNDTLRARPDANRNGVPDGCETPAAGAAFRRGDARVDGAVDMTDALAILRHLFVTGAPLACRKAADANDDARVDVSDAVAILRFLFLGHDAPPEPFPGCGPDPTPDFLGCAGYEGCP